MSEHSSAAGQTCTISLELNGERRELQVQPWTTLLDLLRDQLGLTGTKKGCDHGQCGACTVIAGGRRINSCLSLACMHDGDEVDQLSGKFSKLQPCCDDDSALYSQVLCS